MPARWTAVTRGQDGGESGSGRLGSSGFAQEGRTVLTAAQRRGCTNAPELLLKHGPKGAFGYLCFVTVKCPLNMGRSLRHQLLVLKIL